MGEELDTARRYRFHAEELRTIASDKEMRSSRESLLKIAADYERMAQTLEAIDRTEQTLRNRPPIDSDNPFQPSRPHRPVGYGPPMRG